MILVNGEPQSARAKALVRARGVAQPAPTRRQRTLKAISDYVDNSGWAGRWNGATVVCIASGPSLTAEDVELVRQWREVAGSGEKRRVIVVNTTCAWTPWADALFAMDQKWWKHPDHAKAIGAFEGAKLCIHSVSGMQVTKLQRPDFKHFGNSGAGAISLAVLAGAARVILLGYDCQRTDGKVHFHGDHPKGLGNAKSMPQWFKKFETCARTLRGAEIINCSRATALKCWPRGELEKVLA